jgi:hypothetical protein
LLLDWYNTSPRKLCQKAVFGELSEKDKEVIILAHVLVDNANFGYSDLTNIEVFLFFSIKSQLFGEIFFSWKLKKCNGVEIKNLKQLTQLIEKNTEKFIRFDFEDGL